VEDKFLKPLTFSTFFESRIVCMQTSLFKMSQLIAVPAFAAIMAVSAQAADAVLTDVQFVGLQRLTPESLYPLLTTNVGETVTDQELANSIQALYATGDFANIQAKNENGRVT